MTSRVRQFEIFGYCCIVGTGHVSSSYAIEIASISLNKLIRLFVRRENFLNALRTRSAFVLFHVDKIRLSREMAINLQSSAARSVRSLADSKSMKNSSLRYFFNRVRLTHFDVGVRKLMFKWQACSHRILTAHINRISSAIYLEDVALMRETAIRRTANFHGTPHQSPPRHYVLARHRALGRHFPTFKSLTWILF